MTDLERIEYRLDCIERLTAKERKKLEEL